MKNWLDTPRSCFVVMVAVIWICATVGSAFTHDGTPFGAALVVSLFAGFAYAK